MTIQECNRRTRVLRNQRIERWLDGDISTLVMLHQINYTWGKKWVA
jgi:hypothetical protein